MPVDTKKSKLKGVEAKELHKQVKRKFTRRKVISANVDETWAIDIVQMIQLPKQVRVWFMCGSISLKRAYKNRQTY